MIHKIQNQAIESSYEQHSQTDLILKKEVCSLVKHKMAGLNKGMLIPDDLIAEAERFMDRNVISDADLQCCPQCLKAHVIKKATEFGLSTKEIEFLNEMFNSEIGHNGYYLDADKLIKL